MDESTTASLRATLEDQRAHLREEITASGPTRTPTR